MDKQYRRRPTAGQLRKMAEEYLSTGAWPKLADIEGAKSEPEPQPPKSGHEPDRITQILKPEPERKPNVTVSTEPHQNPPQPPFPKPVSKPINHFLTVAVITIFLGLGLTGLYYLNNNQAYGNKIDEANALFNITGKVTDKNGNPISGAMITCDSARTKADKNGKYKLLGVKESSYEISASANGYHSSTTYIKVDGNKAQNFELKRNKPKTYEITGKVTNKNGKPLAGANVIISGMTSGTVTNNIGAYELSFSKPGNYKLRVSYSGYAPVSQNVKVNSNEVYNFELEKLKAPPPFIYNDDFSTAGKTFDDFSNNNQKWIHESGYLIGFSKNRDYDWYYHLDSFPRLQNAQTFEISIKTVHVNGIETGAFGLLFAGKTYDPSNFFSITNNKGLIIGKYQSNEWHIDYKSEKVAKPSRNWNSLKVVYDGQRFIYFVNGNRVYQQKAKIFGTTIGLFHDNTVKEVWFDDLHIKATYPVKLPPPVR